jgi:hypothetical protein
MNNLGKASKNILMVGIPLVLVAAVVIALYNTNPTKYQSLLQGLTSRFPADAEVALYKTLSLRGGVNRTYNVASVQHATKPSNHWNPLVNKAVDMWCVVIDPASEIRVIDQGNRRLRSFLVYQTKPNGKWLVTDGIAVFHADREEFEDVGCTNYQN